FRATITVAHDLEQNNQLVSPGALQFVHPDLVPEITSAPATATTGESVPFAWTVRNAGTAPAPGSRVDRMFLSADETFDAGDRPVGELAHVGPLDPGGTYTAQLDLTLPNDGAGARFLLLRTDASATVLEVAGEANNQVTSALQVNSAPVATDDSALTNENTP